METSTMTAACVRVRRGMTKNVFLPRFFLSPFAGGSRQAGRFVGKFFFNRPEIRRVASSVSTARA